MHRSVSRALGALLLVGALGGALAHAEARALMVDAFVEPAFARTDVRVAGPVTRMPSGPPPISGGTLLPLGGSRVLVADPDRSRLLVVDLDAPDDRAVTAGPTLRAGAEPGRAALDASGRAHVVLRGAGAIVSFDPARPSEAQRRAVCPMPRGIAYEASGDRVHVACRGGELVTLPAAGGAPTRTLRLDRDLRDVVASGEHLYVSRFRTAELLELDASGTVLDRHRPEGFAHDGVAFTAAVAWRTIGLPDGAIAMLHQRESDGEVRPSLGGYGSLGGGCQGIVRTSITIVRGGLMRAGPELASAVLPVDFALLPSATTAGTFDRLAVATAGNQDGSEPVLIASAPALSADGCIGASVPVSAREAITQTIAVSYLGDRRLVLQQRDPSRLVVLDESGAETRRVALGGDAAFDTGHALFHASTAAGIACASCHPEGGEDGHVWRFMGIGERRTPALHSVSGTAPFHWNGELTDVRALMNEVFVLRMRGTGIDAERADAVEGWLGHVPTPRASSGDGAAIARGRALFAGAGGCAECHSGRALTDGESHDVGTGGSFQTPSLIGVGDRLPVMHTGCASTLRARFEPACGGDRHGDALEPAQLADVVAYMESL